MRRLIVAVAAAGLLAGCGSSTVVIEGEPVPSPYGGPMTLPLNDDDPSVMKRSGAAGRALECDDDPYNGGGAHYDTGLASVQASAADALANLLEEDSPWLVPVDGYRMEREDDGRVLLSYDVDDRTKVAFVAADDVRDYNGDQGWGVEAWAQCDPAELPASVTEALGIGVWEDASGRRVPVTKIRSFQGAEHCDWQHITFLLLGPDDDAVQYVRDTNGELAAFLRTTFDAAAKLPAVATNTEFRRDGRQLWLGPRHEAAYLVGPHDVERWPAAKEPIRCA